MLPQNIFSMAQFMAMAGPITIQFGVENEVVPTNRKNIFWEPAIRVTAYHAVVNPFP